MAWQSEAKTTDLLSELSYCEDRVRDAAYKVRHCGFCTEGWEPVEGGNRRCACFMEWERSMDGWRKAKRDYEKAIKQDVDPTPEMMNLHHVGVLDEEIVTPERQAAIMKNAAELGNKFAEWKMGEEW